MTTTMMRLVCYPVVFLATLLSIHAFVLQKELAPPQKYRSFSRLEAVKRGDARGAALVVEDASVYRGPAPILTDINWRVEPKAKWAILGTNGSGKSTLLGSIMGDVDVADGSIIISTTQQVGYLQQTAVAGSNKTIYEEAASAMRDIQDARAALQTAQNAVEQDPSDTNLKRLDAATQKYEAVGGYTQEQSVSSVLKGLGFNNMERRCDELSGGWQMRVALARLLLSQPTLLLLDEPSNHLDSNARKWLANYLANYQAGAMILVTHDTALLGSVDHIAEVSGGTLQTYKSCTYLQFLEEKQQRADAARSEFETNQKKAAKLQAFVDRFGASATKASAAQSRVKQLEKMKSQGLLEEPDTTHSTTFRPTLTLPDPPKAIGESLLKLEDVSVGWNGADAPLVSNVDLKIKKRMKILIRGPNGAGKSTILAALRGTLEPFEGTRTENDDLKLGIFTQDLAQELDVNARAVDLVLDYAREFNFLLTEQEARGCMGRLGLSGDKSLRFVRDLSGGEKARVALSMFGLTPNNLLILDEPSNHLDRECVQALSEALSEWEGTIVVVSHDQQFCETIGFTHVGTVENGSFTLEERSLRSSDWSEYQGQDGTSANQQEDDEQQQEQRQLDRKLQKQAYNAPKRIEKLEQLMEELEIQVASLNEKMLEHGSNVEKLMELTQEKQSLEMKIDEYMQEWEQLEELLVSVAQS